MATNPRIILFVILGVLLLLLPLLLSNDYFMRVATVILLYVLLASSLNVINGYSGQFNIGHAAFYCIGAYTAAILSTRYGFSFWVLLPLSGLASALFSCLLGIPTLRLRGIYFAMTTLGFSEIIRLSVLNWTSLTRGPMGIPGIPFPNLFGMELRSNAHFYYVILGIVALMLLVTQRVLNSRIGRAWIAIREDQAAARAMGVEAFKYKLINLMFGAFWAGVAGCFYAFFASYISADSFTLDEGFSILAMVLVGGQGTLLGPVIGATFLTLLSEFFRGIAQYRLVIFGIAILLTVYLRPQGIAGSSMLFRRYRETEESGIEVEVEEVELDATHT
ncbi:branched-chain amino acid ABC transporter permease [Atrimonas thermophila]|uniref:branched-chain amino acid ABC transporter permease n=1 Tax=Atrimonas thermophila TaxID=3064161 RepID=UPI00399CD4E5